VRGTLPQVVMAGFLPFSAIYVELYYIFASVWGHKVYIIWSILFIVFLILIVVTAFVTVALTYFQLAVEDHRWWWRSFLCGGSTALFVCVFFGWLLYVCCVCCVCLRAGFVRVCFRAARRLFNNCSLPINNDVITLSKHILSTKTNTHPPQKHTHSLKHNNNTNTKNNNTKPNQT
jgi:hypothetical protein